MDHFHIHGLSKSLKLDVKIFDCSVQNIVEINHQNSEGTIELIYVNLNHYNYVLHQKSFKRKLGAQYVFRISIYYMCLRLCNKYILHSESTVIGPSKVNDIISKLFRGRRDKSLELRAKNSPFKAVNIGLGNDGSNYRSRGNNASPAMSIDSRSKSYNKRAISIDSGSRNDNKSPSILSNDDNGDWDVRLNVTRSMDCDSNEPSILSGASYAKNMSVSDELKSLAPTEVIHSNNNGVEPYTFNYSGVNDILNAKNIPLPGKKKGLSFKNIVSFYKNRSTGLAKDIYSFRFLVCNGYGVYCLICVVVNSNNSFARGAKSTTYYKLGRHCGCEEHLKNLRIFEILGEVKRKALLTAAKQQIKAMLQQHQIVSVVDKDIGM